VKNAAFLVFGELGHNCDPGKSAFFSSGEFASQNFLLSKLSAIPMASNTQTIKSQRLDVTSVKNMFPQGGHDVFNRQRLCCPHLSRSMG